ncbi:MAG TPA: hypothetical protein VFE36_15305 [Candidatus Baltobacteraceae bacterium]|jgi:hypothetical protein|nr:hypothetical protein [Candidatus Baltobacteraceae bacterium]
MTEFVASLATPGDVAEGINRKGLVVAVPDVLAALVAAIAKQTTKISA